MNDYTKWNDLFEKLLDAVSYKKDINIIKNLLNQGASPLWNKYGWTVLHEAARNEYLESLELFLTYEVNVNEKNYDGITPLHYAASRGSLESCKLLVEHYADFNIKNIEGETPLLYLLHYSDLSSDHLKICKYFFQLGVLLQEIPTSWNGDNKKYKSLEICWEWWNKQENTGQELIDIPIEIFERGSEAVNIYFNEIYTSHKRIYRSRICVVGPSGWGKTSLIKSLISSTPIQVAPDIRTIGIDQFQWRFNIAKENINLPTTDTTELDSLDQIRNTEQHQVSFWDFAGQDVYKGAHSIFYSSSRTLFFICVDLQLYYEDIKNDVNNTSEEILRRIRLIFAKQPTANLLFVGTKADLVNMNSTTIQNIKADLSECVDAWCESYSEDINIRQSLLSENATPNQDLQNIQVQLANLKNAVNSKWVITSSQDEDTLKDACSEIQCYIRDKNIGFIMPESYIAVLDYLYQLRKDALTSSNIQRTGNTNSNNHVLLEESHRSRDILKLDTIICSQQGLKRKIREHVLLHDNDDLQNDVGSSGTNLRPLDVILELFHDLGEILMFNNITLNRKKGVIILDPGIMVDLVCDLVRHDLYQYLEHCDNQGQHELNKWKEHLKNGVICHAILRLLPLWSKLTSGQTRVAKELLHECQFLHPVRDTKFGTETNITVPALWFLNRDRTSSPPTIDQAVARRFGNVCVESRMVWEYEFSANTVPESFFEFFVVKSYDYTLEQIVLPNSLEVWMADISSLGLTTYTLSDADHYIIKIEVASNTKEMALQLFQYILSAIESILCDYPGISKTPYIVESTTNKSLVRQVVNSRFLLRRFSSAPNYDWLNENLFLWYYKQFSVDRTDLQKLLYLSETKKLHVRHNRDEERLNIILQNHNIINQNLQHIGEDISERLDNLSIMDASHHEIFQSLHKGEKIRQLPALWTAELKENKQTIYLRLLSDISGKCFHEPIRVVNPLRLLSTYANKLKIGENLLSTVPPNTIPWKQLDLSNIGEIPKTVFNLIHGCNLQSYGIVDIEKSCHMHPEESSSFLMNLLTCSSPKFTLDQIPLLSGLVHGVLSRTGHQLWATKEEIAEFDNTITRL